MLGSPPRLTLNWGPGALGRLVAVGARVAVGMAVAVGGVNVGKIEDGMAVAASPPQAINKRTANDPVKTANRFPANRFPANRFEETIDPISLLSPTRHRTSAVLFPSVRFYVTVLRTPVESGLPRPNSR